MEKFNGYNNWGTWNVCLWMHNDYDTHNCARKCKTIEELKSCFYNLFGLHTPDMEDIEEMKEVNWKEVFKSFS